MDLILLYFLARYNGTLALQKGLKKSTWILYTVAAWLIAEFLGIGFGMYLFGAGNIIQIALFAVFCAFGGYLFVHARLKQQPDHPNKDISDLL